MDVVDAVSDVVGGVEDAESLQLLVDVALKGPHESEGWKW